MCVVRDAWEPSAQLDSGREIPALVEGSANCGGICLGDDEHGQSMGGRVSISKLIPRPLNATTRWSSNLRCHMKMRGCSAPTDDNAKKPPALSPHARGDALLLLADRISVDRCGGELGVAQPLLHQVQRNAG